MQKVISIGKQNFVSLRENDCFYIDKTDLICKWWESKDEITLITRPRRFGKTLNMSMLKCFFEIGCKRELFDGLQISQERELCREYMGQFPVISISLKGIEGMKYQDAVAAVKNVLGMEAMRFSFLLDRI